MSIDQVLTNNLGAVIAICLFLMYLTKRDKLIERSFERFADKLDHLANVIAQLESRLGQVERVRNEREQV